MHCCMSGFSDRALKRLELHVKSAQFIGFELHEAQGAHVLEVHQHFAVDEPAQAFGHAEDVAAQDGAEEAQAFGFVGHLLVSFVVFAFEGEPVVDAVVEQLVPRLQGQLVHVQALHLGRQGAFADAHGLGAALEKSVYFVYPVLEAHQAGLVADAFVLDERVGVAVPLIGVVVEQHMLPPGAGDHCAPKLGYFAQGKVVFENDGQVLYLLHDLPGWIFGCQRPNMRVFVHLHPHFGK